MKKIIIILLILCFILVFCGVVLSDSNRKADYKQFRQKLVELYQQKKYAQGEKLIEKNYDQYPDKLLAMSFNMALFCINQKKYQKVVKYLKKAHQKGYWFNIWALEADLFKPLKEFKSFQKVQKENTRLKEFAESKAKPELKVVLPEKFDEEKEYPLFIALHGGGENLKTFIPRWESKRMKDEYITAYIQSSQMASMDGFHWQDQNKTKRDIIQIYQQIIKKYPVNEGEIIVGGFSSGGYASLLISFFKVLPIKGFIVLCPPVPENITQKEILMAKEQGIRGTLITTGLDNRLHQQKQLIDLFKKVGLQYQLSFDKEKGHWYPADLSERIDQAIVHINNH